MQTKNKCIWCRRTFLASESTKKFCTRSCYIAHAKQKNKCKYCLGTGRTFCEGLVYGNEKIKAPIEEEMCENCNKKQIKQLDI